jgi:hypothetical protein
MAVFWVVAPCSLVEIYQRFRGRGCLHHQGVTTQKTAIFVLTAVRTSNLYLAYVILWLLQGVEVVHARRSSLLQREYSSGHYKCSTTGVNCSHHLWEESSVATDNVSSPANQRLSHVVIGPRDTGQFNGTILRLMIFVREIHFDLQDYFTNCFEGPKLCL